jgi:hypothetical protein
MRYLFATCPDCEYSIVYKTGDDYDIEVYCSLCMSDSGHLVSIKYRDCLPEDNPEGLDERNETIK